MGTTNWTPEPTDAVDRASSPPRFHESWVAGQDGTLWVDLSGILRPSEDPENVEATLWLLPTDPAGTKADASDLIVGSPVVSGATVGCRLAGLAAGRVYRLQILTGADGDQRVATAVVVVAK